MMEAKLENALVDLSVLLGQTRDPWWVIGSAGYTLHGGKLDQISDIDVIVSPADARRISGKTGLNNKADGGDGRFRSAWVLRIELGKIPVELFAGFSVMAKGEWIAILPKTRVPVAIGVATLFVPDKKELAELFQTCGRPADLKRAKALQSMSG